MDPVTICTIGITTAISVIISVVSQMSAEKSSNKMYEKSKLDQEEAYRKSLEDQRRMYNEQLLDAQKREEVAAKEALENSRRENELYLERARSRIVGTGMKKRQIK